MKRQHRHDQLLSRERRAPHSKLGKRLETACGFAWGWAGTVCGGLYAAASARQGRWREAGASAAGMVGGALAKRGVQRLLKMGAPDRTTFSKRRDARRAIAVHKRVTKYSTALHEIAGTHASSNTVKKRPRRR